MSLTQWLTDLWIERQHRNGGRCTECAARGGCMVLLAAVRRRVDRIEVSVRGWR